MNTVSRGAATTAAAISAANRETYIEITIEVNLLAS
jgi:hypothetical protein